MKKEKFGCFLSGGKGLKLESLRQYVTEPKMFYECKWRGQTSTKSSSQESLILLLYIRRGAIWD